MERKPANTPYGNRMSFYGENLHSSPGHPSGQNPMTGIGSMAWGLSKLLPKFGDFSKFGGLSKLLPSTMGTTTAAGTPSISAALSGSSGSFAPWAGPAAVAALVAKGLHRSISQPRDHIRIPDYLQRLRSGMTAQQRNALNAAPMDGLLPIGRRLAAQPEGYKLSNNNKTVTLPSGKKQSTLKYVESARATNNALLDKKSAGASGVSDLKRRGVDFYSLTGPERQRVIRNLK